MDKEIEEMFKNMLDKVVEKRIAEGKTKVKNKTLKANIKSIENVIKTTKEIMNNRDAFDKEEYHHWQGVAALIEVSLNRIFTEEMLEEIKKEGK